MALACLLYGESKVYNGESAVSGRGDSDSDIGCEEAEDNDDY